MMMMPRKPFVIWGAGIRGQIALDFIGKDKVAAFVDQDIAVQKQMPDELTVMTFDDFISQGHKEYIIISPRDSKSIVELLDRNNISAYSLLDEIIY